ncbi:MAG: HPr family phosphocarrier protein [Patescibacteria group bacterium]|nr:HPr family phosphocarrier protein [Patescibacteria group bacterium]
MNQLTATRTVQIINPHGVHARIATLIAEIVRAHHSKVSLTKGRERVEGTEVLQIMSLGAAPGEELLIEAAGDDAEAVVDAVAALVDERFGETDGESEPELL